MSRSAATRAKEMVVIVIAAAAYLIGEWTIIVPESKISEIKLFLRKCYTLESERGRAISNKRDNFKAQDEA